MSESRLALLVGILTLVVNTVMMIQNWKRKPGKRRKRRGRHRKR